MKRSALFGLSPLLLLASTTIGALGSASPASTTAAATVTLGLRVAVPGPLGILTTPPDTPWSARNWSGYAINTSTYVSVTGTWVVPTVLSPTRPSSSQYSSTWVGIDGFNAGDHRLIQAGTEQDWINGTASYQAWWEILPAPESPITSISVQPGNVMTVAITKGSPDWTITMTDVSNGQSFTIKRPFGGSGASAEWIQEAPTVGGHIAPLAHDSTVDFSDLTANSANPGLTTNDAGFVAKRRGTVVISSPSAPNAYQNGFGVAFGPDPPAPPG